jgi:putative peptidoglycan lipid II flippase
MSQVKVTPSPRRFSGGIIRAAIIISLGNILTRIFGLLRDAVLAALFGTTAFATAFVIADNTLSIFFDLLVSGAISSALVPVLSRYAARAEDRAEFWRVVNVLLTLGLLFLIGVVALLQLVADPLARFMATKETDDIKDLTVGLTRIILLAIVFLGVSSIMTAALQALQRFVWSAISLAARNLGIIIVAVSLGWLLGVWSMVLGVLFGTFLLIVLQAPGLRDIPLKPSFEWNHPAVRQILKLYLPIFLGLLITSLALVVDRNLANQAGSEAIPAMRYATNLQQFALGLVGSAISLAILPTLSRLADDENSENFRFTLMSGLRLLLVLVIPATLGLLALALPTITVIYQRAAFNDESKWFTLVALLGYLPGVPAAALDQMLIFSFYARKNTLTPVLVGVFSNLVYLTVALLCTWLLPVGALRILGLVLANSLQQLVHMLVMFVLLRRLFGTLRGNGLFYTLLKSGLGALLMAAVAFLVAGFLTNGFNASGFLPNLLGLAIGTTSGAVVYLLALRLLKVEELNLVVGAVRRKLKG